MRRRSADLRWPKTRPPSGYRGLFINLDRAKQRCARIENHLKELVAPSTYLRLRATDGRNLRAVSGGVSKPGAGCFYSHLRAVDLARASREPVHIIEDDARLTSHVPAYVKHVVDTGLLDQVDILFLDMWIDPDWSLVSDYDRLFRRFSEERHAGRDTIKSLHLLDLKGRRVGAARSYLVNRSGAEKLFALLAKEGRKWPRMPVDSFIGECSREGHLTAKLAFPFLTFGDLSTSSESDIQTIGSEAMLAQDAVRLAFTVDVNVRSQVLPIFDRLIATGRHPGLRDVRHLLVTRPQQAGEL